MDASLQFQGGSHGDWLAVLLLALVGVLLGNAVWQLAGRRVRGAAEPGRGAGPLAIAPVLLIDAAIGAAWATARPCGTACWGPPPSSC